MKYKRLRVICDMFLMDDYEDQRCFPEKMDNRQYNKKKVSFSDTFNDGPVAYLP